MDWRAFRKAILCVVLSVGGIALYFFLMVTNPYLMLILGCLGILGLFVGILYINFKWNAERREREEEHEDGWRAYKAKMEERQAEWDQKWERFQKHQDWEKRFRESRRENRRV